MHLVMQTVTNRRAKAAVTMMNRRAKTAVHDKSASHCCEATTGAGAVVLQAQKCHSVHAACNAADTWPVPGTI